MKFPAWLTTALLLIISSNQINAQGGCKDALLDLAIAVDGSGSICGNNGLAGCLNWPLVLDFIELVVNKLEISATSARLSLITFSNGIEKAFLFNEKQSAAEILPIIRNLNYPDSNTNTQLAFEYLRTTVFNEANGDRPDVRNVAIVVTDGNPTVEPEKTIPNANDLRSEDDVNTIAIGVTSAVNETILRLISSPPQLKDRNYFSTPDFDGLAGIIDSLIEVACAPTLPPTVPPTAPNAPSAPACRVPADIVFIVDSSGSIQEENFNRMKSFLSGLAGELDIDKGVIRFGVLQFSTDVELEFNMNDYTARADIQSHIQGMPYIRGTTNTAEAIKYADTTMFTKNNGDRSTAENIIVVMTDGGSNDKLATFSEATKAKTRATLITMGLGNWVDTFELKALASDSYKQNLILVERWNQLDSFIDVLRDMLCNSVDECETRPCQNGGTCVDSIDRYYCNCRENYGGNNCQYRCNNPADVVFAVDSSGSIGRQNFQTVVDFVKAITMQLPVNGGTRVGLETFSDKEQLYMNLKDNTDIHSLMDAMSVPYFYGGSTNTPRALQFMREDMFTSSSGDDKDQPNVGLVITDGRSRDKAATWAEAISNRKQNIHMMAVGVTNSIRYDELRMIASAPDVGNIWTVDDFEDLDDDLVADLRNAICNNENECDSDPCENGGECRDQINGYTCVCADGFTGLNCERDCSGAADILIIMDKSGSVRHERFDEVKDFLANIVEQFEIVGDVVRVGAVSFSSVASVEFELDSYSSKQDIQEALRSVPYSGQRTNLAAALELARTQIFTTANGDRNNVPNFALIFTDGGSNIRELETLPEAIQLRVAGVYIIIMAVGQDLNMQELRGIASQPVTTNVITVKSFNEMESMVNDIVTKTCNDENECASNPCTNGGTCVDEIAGYSCVCLDDRSGYNCERSCSRRYDINFILDLSGSVNTDFEISTDFIRQAVYGLQFSFGRTRVSLITFADDAQVEFYLDDYSDKRDVLNALSFMQRGGRTNTQAALQLANNEVFTQSRGDRTGDKNVVVLLSDGGSNIVPEQTVPKASDLKNNGVDIYVVAIGDQVDMNEINDIASQTTKPFVTRLEESGEVAAAVGDLLDNLC